MFKRKSHACFFFWCSKQGTHLFSRTKSSGSFTKKCESDPIKNRRFSCSSLPADQKSGASVNREKSTVSLIKGPKFLSFNFFGFILDHSISMISCNVSPSHFSWFAVSCSSVISLKMLLLIFEDLSFLVLFVCALFVLLGRLPVQSPKYEDIFAEAGSSYSG